MKKVRKKSLYYVMFLSLSTLVLGIYFIMQGKDAYSLDVNENIAEHTYYNLKSNATDYQKELYEQLMSALEENPRDDSKLAGLVVDNYVADYFTWTNKTRYNDVSAAQFINADVKQTFYHLTLDTFYNDLGYYIDKGTQKDTLEVTKVSSKVEAIEYEVSEEYKKDGEIIDAVVVDAFLVNASWTYKSSTVVDSNAYQNEGYFVVVKDEDGLYSIIEAGDVYVVGEE